MNYSESEIAGSVLPTQYSCQAVRRGGWLEGFDSNAPLFLFYDDNDLTLSWSISEIPIFEGMQQLYSVLFFENLLLLYGGGNIFCFFRHAP